MTLGEKIKRLRKSKNLTQQEMAEKIGMTQQNYCRIETEKVKPSLKRLEQIAQVLGIDISDIFKSEEIISSTSQDMISLPIVGNVTAGTPLLVRENLEGYMEVPKDIAPSEEAFVLKVKGDSMKDAGIQDGSYVVVKKQPTCDNGDIIAFLLNGENVGIRKFYKVGDKIVLEASNPACDPILVDEKHEFMILGKVVGWWVKR